ncbi:hypothetical protein Taro_053164, partial [Colocasia esculenta]|nr:hypothetical protein [Colocasia esculenta]
MVTYAVNSSVAECCELLYLSELRVVICKFSGDRRGWFSDLVVCPRSRVVLVVGPRPCEAKGSSSRELSVGQFAEAAMVTYAVSSSVAECCELLYLSELRVVICKFS